MLLPVKRVTILIAFALFFQSRGNELKTAFEEYGVKVYRPTGPSSLSLQCNEYGYIRFRIVHPDVLSTASYFDLDFIRNDTGEMVQKIIEKAPVQQVGYVAFFPWNAPNLQSQPVSYSVAMTFFSEGDDEKELEFRILSNATSVAPARTFKRVSSPSFCVPECSAADFNEQQ